MKITSLIIKEIRTPILRGVVLGTLILIFGWLGGADVTHLADNLFIVAVILLFVGPILFRPKGLSFAPSSDYPAPTILAPSDDTSLLELSEEEQKKYLSLEGYVVLIQMEGIGITLFFYSLVFYTLFGR